MHKSKVKITNKELKNIVQTINPKWKLSSVKLLELGIVNPLYEICINSKTYILKVCNPTFESWKLEKEVLAIQILKDKTEIPVPEVIYVDSSKNIIPYNFFLMEKLDGINLYKNYSKFSHGQLKKIFAQLGAYLTEIHSIKFNSFGDFTRINDNIKITLMQEISTESKKINPGPYYKWFKQFNAFVDNLWKGVKKGTLKEHGKILYDYIKNNINIININAKPRFVHGDYGMHNILVKGKVVTGIVDLEWSHAGCAEYDYSRTENDFFGFFSPLKEKKKLKQVFSKSYKILKIPEYDKRRKIYEANYYLNAINAYPWEVVGMTKKQKNIFTRKLKAVSKSFKK